MLAAKLMPVIGIIFVARASGKVVKVAKEEKYGYYARIRIVTSEAVTYHCGASWISARALVTSSRYIVEHEVSQMTVIHSSGNYAVSKTIIVEDHAAELAIVITETCASDAVQFISLGDYKHSYYYPEIRESSDSSNESGDGNSSGDNHSGGDSDNSGGDSDDSDGDSGGDSDGDSDNSDGDNSDSGDHGSGDDKSSNSGEASASGSSEDDSVYVSNLSRKRYHCHGYSDQPSGNTGFYSITVRNVKHKYCRTVDSSVTYRNTICTYARFKETTSCHVEQGSPCTHKGTLVAITRYRNSCAYGTHETMTSIAYYRPWIEEQIFEYGMCN